LEELGMSTFLQLTNIALNDKGCSKVTSQTERTFRAFSFYCCELRLTDLVGVGWDYFP